MVMPVCNSSTWNPEAVGIGVLGKTGIHRETISNQKGRERELMGRKKRETA